MNFTVRELYNKKFSVLDIGSYKIRCLSWKLEIDDIDVIWYAEKRQEEETFFSWEVENIKELKENIETCLKKAEKWEDIEEVIVNTLSPHSFLFSHQLNHVRKYPLSPISEEEMYEVIRDFEKKCFRESFVDIELKNGYKKEEIKNIFSSILSVKIDGKKVSSLYGKTGKNIKISLVNIFIPLRYYILVKDIFTALWRISFITIPFEYSILRYFPEESVVLINIGNTKTYIGIKIGDEIVGTTRINIGINDLVKKIKERNPQIPLFQIIKWLDTSAWTEEKKEFLEIFHFCIVEGVKEVLKWETCPNKFFFFGWGGNNDFIRKSFETIDTFRYQLKIINSIESIDLPDFWKSDSGNFLKNISNIDLLSTILTYEDKEERKNDALTAQLGKIIEEIEKQY